MQQHKWIREIRILVALAFLVFAALEASLIFIAPAFVLLFLVYKDINCILCEAGFCQPME
jgi:hypothetical protein